MDSVRASNQSFKVTAIGWPLVAFLVVAFALGATFWFASSGDVRNFFGELKPQDWATVLSGVFAALSFPGLVIPLIYQRVEINHMQQQIFDQNAALVRHAMALEVQNQEVQQQTQAVVQQVSHHRAALALQRLGDIDAQIVDMEEVVEEKLKKLLQKLKVRYEGSATSYVLQRDDAPVWLAHSLNAAQLINPGPPQNTQVRSEIIILFNTIISRCRAVRGAVELVKQENPELKERVDLKLKDSDIYRIDAIFAAARRVVRQLG